MKLLRIPRPMYEVLMRAGLQGCSGGAKEGLDGYRGYQRYMYPNLVYMYM
jgi:hypothetical protein